MTKVLDHGYVSLEEHNSEQLIWQLSGICFNREREGTAVDDTLFRFMHRLLFNNERSPFEFLKLRYKIKAPIFVLRHLFRHRTANIIELSRRHTGEEIEFYAPPDTDLADYYRKAVLKYSELLEKGCPREQARVVLPLSLYSTCYWAIDGRNLTNLLEQRTSVRAQKETRDYARAFMTEIKDEMPIFFRVLEEHLQLRR